MKKLQKISVNNKGATAIMFAMFFVIIISLITIGFATLVRRDQRATLDKTLSMQAQLLAESGVNSVKQYLYNYATPVTNPNCIPAVPGYVMPTFTDTSDRITCITWSKSPTESTFSLKPYESYSFNQKNHTGWTKLEWSTDGAANNAYYAQLAGNQLPSIASGNKSIIKMVTVNREDIYDVSPKKVQVVYLVPYGGADVSPSTVTPAPNNSDFGNDYVDLGNAGVGTLTTETSNGLVYYVPCPSDKCSINIAGYAFANGAGVYGDRMFYFMPLGTNETTIQYQSLIGYNGVPQPLDGIQVKIDVTAISQDQIKRLITYVPTKSDTDVWKPFFGALADELCKDIKIDAINGSTASGVGAVCP